MALSIESATITSTRFRTTIPLSLTVKLTDKCNATALLLSASAKQDRANLLERDLCVSFVVVDKTKLEEVSGCDKCTVTRGREKTFVQTEVNETRFVRGVAVVKLVFNCTRQCHSNELLLRITISNKDMSQIVT